MSSRQSNAAGSNRSYTLRNWLPFTSTRKDATCDSPTCTALHRKEHLLADYHMMRALMTLFPPVGIRITFAMSRLSWSALLGTHDRLGTSRPDPRSQYYLNSAISFTPLSYTSTLETDIPCRHLAAPTNTTHNMSAEIADTCIVCLGDLRAALAEDPPPLPLAVAADDDAVDAKEIATSTSKAHVDDATCNNEQRYHT